MNLEHLGLRASTQSVVRKNLQ